MKIIILGAGQVGEALATTLLKENHDITLVDTDSDRLEQINARLDLSTLAGHASYPNTLQAAGAADCDMLIAVTGSDEANMIACQVGYSLFEIPKKIARIRSPQYLINQQLFDAEHLPIDVAISPEQLVATRIAGLINYPGTLQVIDFCESNIKMIAIKCLYNSPLVSIKLNEISGKITKIDTRAVAIFRSDQAVPLDGETTIEIGDEIFFIAAKKNITKLLNDIQPDSVEYKNIMIVGGGGIGTTLAKQLEGNYNIKLIEKNLHRCEYLADHLKKTTVLHGEGNDTDLLENENINKTDVLCAVTGDDESNIMSCLQAKRLGVNPVIANISRAAYVDLIQGGPINIAISPQQITVGSILTQIRRGDIIAVHSLRRGVAEAIEIVAHGDKKTSQVVGKALQDIKLPTATTIGAIMRDGKVIIPSNDSVIATEDHLIIFVSNKQHVSQVEKLFRVKATFF